MAIASKDVVGVLSIQYAEIADFCEVDEYGEAVVDAQGNVTLTITDDAVRDAFVEYYSDVLQQEVANMIATDPARGVPYGVVEAAAAYLRSSDGLYGDSVLLRALRARNAYTTEQLTLEQLCAVQVVQHYTHACLYAELTGTAQGGVQAIHTASTYVRVGEIAQDIIRTLEDKAAGAVGALPDDPVRAAYTILNNAK